MRKIQKLRSKLSFWGNHSCRRDTAHIKLQWAGAAQVYLVTGICGTRGVQGGSAITLARREDHRPHRSGRTSESEVNKTWLGKAWICPEWKYIPKYDRLADSPQPWGNREGLGSHSSEIPKGLELPLSLGNTFCFYNEWRRLEWTETLGLKDTGGPVGLLRK